MRILFCAAFIVLALPAQGANLSPQTWTGLATESGVGARLSDLLAGPDAIDAACCKTCRKGKACGDTCISRDKACHVGAGCACQAPGN